MKEKNPVGKNFEKVVDGFRFKPPSLGNFNFWIGGFVLRIRRNSMTLKII
jgi:hypothetical protein